MTSEFFDNFAHAAESEQTAASSLLYADASSHAPSQSHEVNVVMFHPDDRDKAAKPLDLIDHLRFMKNDAYPRYDPGWKEHHEQLVNRAHQGDIGKLFLGDSITDWMNVDLLHKKFGNDAINFGIAGDHTENLLWRMRNGELEIQGNKPKLAVVLIGTNNLSSETNDEIGNQVELNLQEIRKQLPDAKVLLLGILPRDEMPDTENRKRIIATNELYEKLADNQNIFYADIGKQLLEPDGKISPEIMYDFLHPTNAGYERMFDAIKPYTDKILQG